MDGSLSPFLSLKQTHPQVRIEKKCFKIKFGKVGGKPLSSSHTPLPILPDPTATCPPLSRCATQDISYKQDRTRWPCVWPPHAQSFLVPRGGSLGGSSTPPMAGDQPMMDI